MAASRRDTSLSLRLPATPTLLPDRPPISALFLIDFDVKAGYTIVWKQTEAGLDIEGTVEYKSLPSGLHTVQDDLIYFVHQDGYAGLSAFVNSRTDDEETRHARMIAVGVLVPLTYGRLGRSWRHAEALTDMARKLAEDGKQTRVLESYWAEHRKNNEGNTERPLQDSPLSSPSVAFHSARPPSGKGHSRKRSASDGAALIPPGHRLSPFHPAWSLTRLLDTFGPLIFPLHRFAMLRKRILISTHAPVHETCNFVYDISVLANVPLSVVDLLEVSAPVQRLRPLFTIGVHDIPWLVEDRDAAKRPSRDDAVEEDDAGWVACTTDSILAMKEDLWDVLVTMPPNYSVDAKNKVWPAVECPKGQAVKATQRDLRRFRALKTGLARLGDLAAREAATPRSGSTPTALSRRRMSATSLRTLFPDEDPRMADAAETLVEPMTWAALAYTGFMWWASAGEQRRAEDGEESALDAALLADLAPAPAPVTRTPSWGGMMDSVSSLTARRAGSGAAGRATGTDAGRATPETDGRPAAPTPAPTHDDHDDERARAELAIIAYFHRLTTQMLSVLADIVDRSSEDDDSSLMTSEATSLADGGDGAALLSPGGSGGSDDGQHDGGGGPGAVRVDADALHRMGLDVWSRADAGFVRDVMARYFARRAVVDRKGVDICGLRVC